MPTIGQTECCSAIFGVDFFLDDFDRSDFVPLVLIREGDFLGVVLRFAAMRPCYVRLSLFVKQAAIVITGCERTDDWRRRSPAAELILRVEVRLAMPRDLKAA
jgi:hypothetical protein